MGQRKPKTGPIGLETKKLAAVWSSGDVDRIPATRTRITRKVPREFGQRHQNSSFPVKVSIVTADIQKDAKHFKADDSVGTLSRRASDSIGSAKGHGTEGPVDPVSLM